MVRKMDEKGFRQSLKKTGKKEHVVEGLVRQVQAFEVYLVASQQCSVEDVPEQEVREYAKTLSKGEIKERMRGLALYFKFVGNLPLARLASDIREQEISKTRTIFKLREFRGVSLDEVSKLEATGIVTVEDMLTAGRTLASRQQLAEQTGVSPQVILELVKLSDLSRLGAVKAVRARLYYEASLDTPDKFVQWEAEALRQMLVEFVERTGFDGIAPLPKELRNAIETARRLPEAVEY
jgi:DNA-binding transcriptional regulator YhcF (GntR family)